MKLRRLVLPILGAALVAGGLTWYLRARTPRMPSAKPLRLEAGFSGCARVDRGPVCVIEPKQRLTLFVPSGSKAVEIGTNEGPVTISERTPVDDGVRYVVELPEAPTSLVIRHAGAELELALAKADDPAVLRDARKLRGEGKPETAERLLRDGLARAESVERGRLNALLGRILIARGEREPGQELLRDALDSAENAGRFSDAVEDALALAHGHIMYDREFAPARELLARAKRLATESSGLESSRVSYYEGVLAAATGDRGGALDRYREAKQSADRFAIQPLAGLVTHQLALTLASLGRTGEALDLLRSVFPKADSDAACNRATIHADIVWLLRLAHPNDPPPAARVEAEKHLTRARELLKSACVDPIRKLDAHLTAAEWSLAIGDAAAAGRELVSVRHVEKNQAAGHGLWRIDVDARQKLLSKNARGAREQFQREAILADAALDLESHWRSQVGIGNALEDLGRPREAIDAYRNAERDLDRMLVMIPLNEGRDSFAGVRDSAARRLVALLTRENRAGEALEVARWARIRALRSAAQVRRLSSLSGQERSRWDAAVGKYRRERAAIEAEAQNDWQLAEDELSAARGRRSAIDAKLRSSLDEAYRVISSETDGKKLAAPRRGELLLAFFPVDDGIVAFAATERETLVREVGRVDSGATPEALARQLLQPFSAAIEAAEKVRILTYGYVRAIDFHALPFGGSSLAARRTVEYALDLGTNSTSRGKGALVVADPKSDLPRAREEGAELGRHLKPVDGTPIELLLGDAARRSRVLEQIARVRWFHFAGHGNFAGAGGSDSALELADGRISLGDVLALPQVPDLVVLNACDAARTSERALPESFGLAQAFLVRGANGVIAPTRPVRDEAAALLGRELYAQMGRGKDSAAALGQAAESVRSRDPKADWAAFRALAP